MPARLHKRIVVGCLALGLAGSLVGVGTVKAGATNELLTCVSSGTVDITPNTAKTAFDWSIAGTGACVPVTFPIANTESVTFSGTGTSSTLGLCSGVVVTNLDITVTMSLFDPVKKVTRVVQDHWGLAISTFPLAVPFLISNGSTGAGTMLTHILLTCPPKGTDSANFAWTQILPTA